VNEDILKELDQLPRIVRATTAMPLPTGLVARIAGGEFDHGLWLGRGTSKLAGMWLSSAFAELSDFRVYHAPLSMATRRPCKDLSRVLYFALSESGETEDVVEAARRGKEHDATCYAIVNDEKSELMRLADHATCLDARPNWGYTFLTHMGTLVMAMRLAAAAGGRDVPAGLGELPDAAARAIAENPLIELAEIGMETRRAMFLGRGLSTPIAANLAMKYRETPLIAADHKSGEEYLHGYGETAEDKDCLHVVLVTDRDFMAGQLKTTRHLVKRGARVVVLTIAALAPRIPGDLRTLAVDAPDCPFCAPLCLSVAFCRMLFDLANARGLDTNDDNIVGKYVSPASFTDAFPELK